MHLHNDFTALMPVLIKARLSKTGKRLLRINASVEQTNTGGDCITIGARLNSADEFVRSGALDLDHLSEIGERLGVKDPMSYIFGAPLRAFAASERRTMVDGIIQQGTQKADEFWQSIAADPPVQWGASIYGFPASGGLIDARKEPGHPLVKRFGATRFVVTKMLWRSLGMTRNPICSSVLPAEVIRERELVRQHDGPPA